VKYKFINCIAILLLAQLTLYVILSTQVYAKESSQVLPTAEENTFDIWEYRIEGNTLLDSTQIEKAVYGFLGPDKSLEVVEQARTSLEERYHAIGFATVLVDIPEQQVESGIIRLKVTEASIQRVKVSGSRYFSNRRIKSLVPSLQKEQVPDINEVQNDLALLNARSRDRSITPVLRPGKTPGTVEMELKVKDESPLHYSLELNDRNTPDTTDYRLNASLSYDNLWQKEHSATISYQTSPKDRNEVDVWSLNYLYKPENSKNLLLFYAVDSESDVATIGDLSVIGNGKIFGSRFIAPLIPSGNIYHNIVAGFDYKDFDDSILLGGISSPELGQAIEYGTFSLAYGGTVLHENSMPTNFNFATNFGVRGIYNNEPEFEDKRAGSDPNFIYFTGNINKDFELVSDYHLHSKVAGQFSGSPLISNEQYSLGGVDSVRGYLESDVLVDFGINTSMELRSPILFEQQYKWVNHVQLFSFVDWATGEIRDALPEQASSFDLLGVGAGVRFTLRNDFEGSLSWARPLKETNSTEKDDDRMHFSVKYHR